MDSVDLTSRNQRYGLLALTVAFPALWLIGLPNVFDPVASTRFATLPAFPVFLVSAAGALAAILRARSGRPASSIQRCSIYIVWGWLVPFCVIAVMTVSRFDSLWPALVILAVPAPAFLFLRIGRERLLLWLVGCVALAWLALVTSSEAPFSFNARLIVPLILTAGPFWSLAGYAALFEHVVHTRAHEPDGGREIWLACLVSLLGILLFFGLLFGLVALALSGM
jgi:hypothetical protein